MKKQSPKKRATRADAEDRALTLDELASKEPVAAIGGPPSSLLRELERTRGALILTEAMEISAQAVARAARRPIRTDAYRPQWVGVDYLPKIRPHHFRVPPIRRGRGIRGRPGDIGLKPLMNESLTFSWPWRTIGKVRTGVASDFTNATVTGTGVLVGPNLMLTASHVAAWGGGWMHFTPGFRDGVGDPRFGSSFVERFRGIRAGGSPTGYDYVICKLQTPIGQNTGWMGTRSFGDEDQYYDGTWFLNGFPGDFMNGQRLAVEFPLDIEDIDNDDPGLELETDFFVTGGWSGGPLWGWITDPHVIGITSGWEVDGYDPIRSVMAGGRHLVELTQFGWSNWQ